MHDSNGNTLWDVKSIQKYLYPHFKYLYTEPGSKNPYAKEVMLEKIPSIGDKAENLFFEKEILENEVIEVIWSLDPNKSPRLDGSIYIF